MDAVFEELVSFVKCLGVQLFCTLGHFPENRFLDGFRFCDFLKFKNPGDCSESDHIRHDLFA